MLPSLKISLILNRFCRFSKKKKQIQQIQKSVTQTLLVCEDLRNYSTKKLKKILNSTYHQKVCPHFAVIDAAMAKRISENAFLC